MATPKTPLHHCLDGEIDLNYGGLQANWHPDTPDMVEIGTTTGPDGYEVAGYLPVKGLSDLLANIPKTVYAVSFFPADENGGSGGFFWFEDMGDACQTYRDTVADSLNEVTAVRMVQVTVPGNLTHDEITQYLDSNLDMIEVNLPPIAQYLPPETSEKMHLLLSKAEDKTKVIGFGGPVD